MRVACCTARPTHGGRGWRWGSGGMDRGLMEFIEMLKTDERFLYVLLTLSQEQNIKTGRFSLIYADEVVVSHTNEHEYQSFVGNKKSEALQDRIILVKVPYNLQVSKEVHIYEKLLKQSNLQNVHIAPHALHTAAMFAVLSRLEPSKKAGVTTSSSAMPLLERPWAISSITSRSRGVSSSSGSSRRLRPSIWETTFGS